eukprot:m.20179 g.20179  ORF g.20179 m.20179 type:complete len:873 (-) comp6107_c0_seq1:89-2707(-)
MTDCTVLADSLLTWLHSFDGVQGARESLQDLTDGIAMAEVFAIISPEHLPAEKLSKLHRGVEDNTPLKVSNVKKLKRAVLDFYEQELNVAAHQLVVPDEAAIEKASVEDLCHMLELLLGCAVQCADKERHVQNLMMLEGEQVKADLMASIQRLMAVTAEAFEAVSPEEAAALKSEKEEAVFRLQQLEAQHNELLERHQTIEAENVKLSQRLLEAASETTGPSDNSEEVLQVRRQLTEARDTLTQERDEHSEILKEKNKEALDLRRQLETLQEQADQGLRLRDEVEELRSIAAKAPQLERRVEQYKQKLEEYADLAKQAKALEEQNSSHVKRILQLEDGESKLLKLEARIGKYKQQVDDLENALKEEQRRCEKFRHERTKYEEECQSLQARLDEALSNTGRDSLGNISVDAPSLGDALGMAESSGLREKLIRLEHENEILRQGSVDEQVEDLHAQNTKLEAECKELRVSCARLESDLEFSRKSTASSNVKSTSDVAYEQLATVERELKQAKEKLALAEAAKHQLAATSEELTKTQEELIALKKEHSLLGLDQKQMLEQMRQKAEAELQEKLQQGLGEAQAQVTKLTEELEAKVKECADTAQQFTALEAKHAALVQENEETESKLREKMEHVNRVLQEKDDVQSKLVSMASAQDARMLEQEQRFKEATAKMQETMQQQLSEGGSKSSQEGASVEMLQLRLKLTELEKDHVQELSERDRKASAERSQIDTELRDRESKIRELEGDVNRQKAKLQEKSEMLDKFKSELKRCMDVNKQLRKGGTSAGASDEVVQLLKQQKAELESKYEYEKQNREKLKQQHEREMKLMVTAWYDMSLQHQRFAIKDQDRAAAGHAGAAAGNSSFLSRQRHGVTNSQR